MSKAFTREDDQMEPETAIRPLADLPGGIRNYMTREGIDRFQNELESLQARRVELSVDLEKNRIPIKSIDARSAQIKQILADAEVVDPIVDDTAHFGASVSVKYPLGDLETFRIVGVHEIDLSQNQISWQSPLGKILLNRRAGDIVRFNSPSGEQKLQILRVSY